MDVCKSAARSALAMLRSSQIFQDSKSADSSPRFETAAVNCDPGEQSKWRKHLCRSAIEMVTRVQNLQIECRKAHELGVMKDRLQVVKGGTAADFRAQVWDVAKKSLEEMEVGIEDADVPECAFDSTKIRDRFETEVGEYVVKTRMAIFTREVRDEANAIITEFPNIIWQRLGGIRDTLSEAACEDVGYVMDGLKSDWWARASGSGRLEHNLRVVAKTSIRKLMKSARNNAEDHMKRRFATKVVRRS